MTLRGSQRACDAGALAGRNLAESYFFALARTFAQRFLAAAAIFALPAADKTRFFTPANSWLVDLPNALAAVLTPAS